jgi:hypothetical protein
MAKGLISPSKRTTLQENISKGPTGIPPLLNPLISCLRCGPIFKSSLPQVNTPLIKSSLIVAVGGRMEAGFLSQRKFRKSAKIHLIE